MSKEDCFSNRLLNKGKESQTNAILPCGWTETQPLALSHLWKYKYIWKIEI